MTDFVGFLPLPEGGASEAALTADYNAEMIEQIARFPRVRDRAIFVGEPADVVPDTFGPGLPEIRAWTEGHYDFCGYIPAPDLPSLPDRATLRAELGWSADETICVVAVGGTAVGEPLLRRAVQALPALRARVPGLRMSPSRGRGSTRHRFRVYRDSSSSATFTRSTENCPPATSRSCKAG